MTVDAPSRQVLPALVDPASAPLHLVTFDLYRDVHKGIRAELLALTGAAGRLDAVDGDAVAALCTRLSQFLDLLDEHARHEDDHLAPVIAVVDEVLTERIAHEHRAVEDTMTGLRVLAATAPGVATDGRPLAVHRLYLAMANFTSEYLAHLSTEEVEVMPAVAARIPLDELLDVNAALVGAIAPADLDRYMTIIVPAQSHADRVAMYAGMRTGAPPAAFARWLEIAAGVLSPEDHARLDAELRATA